MTTMLNDNNFVKSMMAKQISIEDMNSLAKDIKCYEKELDKYKQVFNNKDFNLIKTSVQFDQYIDGFKKLTVKHGLASKDNIIRNKQQVDKLINFMNIKK
jgi:hypothetical protein